MKRQITISKNIGFCSGVRRAIEKAQTAAAQFGKVAMLGEIVHNEKVVQQLEEKGVHVYRSLAKIEKGTPVIFRSHGTPPAVWKEARHRALTIIDATCPLVKKIHDAVRELENEGRQIVIIGDHNHEEVEGIASQVQAAKVIASADEAKSMPMTSKIGVVIQSTQDIFNVLEIVAVLLTKTNDLHVVNTICKPTRERQEQIRRLASENEVMIIIGSASSANTNRLTALARAINPNTYQIADSTELQAEWFKNVQTVGVSTGASTPDELVEAVVKKINEFP